MKRRGVVIYVASTIALALIGCGGGTSGPAEGSEGGPCYGNGTCDTGLVCGTDDICHKAEPNLCQGVECSGHGTCAVDTDGNALCVCDDGYHRDGLACLQDDPCDPDPCSGNGTCDAGSCTCDQGYTGSACDSCASGYHPEGAACVADSCVAVLSDDFDDGDASDWSFQSWGPNTSNVSWQISPNAGGYQFEGTGGVSTGGGNSIAFPNSATNYTDMVLEADITNVAQFHTTAGNGGLALRRATDGSLTFYLCYVAPSLMFISKFNNGDYGTSLASDDTISFPVGSTAHLRFEAIGSTLRCILDDSTVLETTDTDISAGSVGIVNMGGTKAFDNVVLRDCSGGQACDITQVESLNPLPLDLRTVASLPDSGFIYLVGGYEINSGATTICLANIWSYATASDTIADLGTILPYARCPSTSTEAAWADNGKLYISPGLGPTVNNGWGSHSCIIEFDPSGPGATEKACFPSTRWGLSVINGHDGYLYFIGGWNGGSLTGIWRYDPQSNQLTDTGASIPIAGNSINAVVTDVSDGRTYVFTNQYDSYKLYLFDPADLSFIYLADTGYTPTNAWLGSNGLVYTLTGADPDWFSKLITYDPAADLLAIEDLGVNVFGSRTAPVFSPDTGESHLYAFGGSVSGSNQPTPLVERTLCLP